MPARNALYAQSGGVTPVINVSAAGVILTARHHTQYINKMYAGQDGILGVLHENLIDIDTLSKQQVQALQYTPGGAFGSCRYKLKSPHQHHDEYQRLLDVFEAYDIGYFFYNGGGDSQDTAHKIAQYAESTGYPLNCIGIPKTIDNDLPITDCSPGFGSVAKYVAVSVLEASMDVHSMHSTSTKVFVMEVMGRHAGWIAAAAALAADERGLGPDIILFPEIDFTLQSFITEVKRVVQQKGYCTVVVSEGVKTSDGKFLSESDSQDAFGHSQLGGVAPLISNLIKQQAGYKCHWAVADYLQRSARHIGSATDIRQAYAVGEAAVEFAIKGRNGIMPIIVRTSDQPYEWHIDSVPLQQVANQEKKLPRQYIRDDGFFISALCRQYLAPLIIGEDYPPFEQGIPQYIRIHPTPVAKKLTPSL